MATAVTQSRRGMTLPRRILGAHAGQDILASTQTDKKRKGNEPDTQSKVGRHLGKGGHLIIIDLVRLAPVVLSALGRRQWLGEVAKPEPMVEENQDTGQNE